MNEWEKKKKAQWILYIYVRVQWMSARICDSNDRVEEKNKINKCNQKHDREKEKKLWKKMPQNRSINTPAHEGKKTNKNNLFFSKATEIWYKQTHTHTHTFLFYI